MKWFSHIVRRMGPVFVATVIVVFLQSGQAKAGRFEDALTLVRSGDIDRIEQTFAADYQAFIDGKLSAGEFEAPYSAFSTLDPVVLDMIAQWRANYPDSAYARVAEAGPKRHLAAVLRGEDVIARTPRKSLERAQLLWTEASALLNEALDIAPQHIQAAGILESVSFYLHDNESALRAKTVLATYGSEVSLLLGVVHEATPQWGGSEAKMHRLCDELAPKIEGISVAECHARATLMLPDLSNAQREEAIEILRREDPEGNWATIARQLLYLGKAREALAKYDERDAWIPRNLANTFAVALNDYAVQERIADRWLAINPLHPRALALKSEAQGRRGDNAGAAETIEKAMIYGETIPEVRRWRFASIIEDESRREEMLGELEDALVDTDFHPLIMAFALEALVWYPPERTRYWSDGTEHSNYECRRARILSHAFNGCARHSNRQGTLGCSDATLLRVQEILGEVDLHACANLIGRLQ